MVENGAGLINVDLASVNTKDIVVHAIYIAFYLPRGLLEAVEGCGYDMKKVGECFLQTWSREEGCQLYSQYCTKYPL